MEDTLALTITDLVVLALFLIYFLLGWRKGIVRVLIGPASFAVCFVIAILNLDFNYNIVKSALILTLGTLVLSIIINLFFYIGKFSMEKEQREYVFIGSRILGSLLNLAWKGGVTLFLLLVLTFVPLNAFGLDKARGNMKNSVSYKFTQHFAYNNIKPVREITATLAILKDPTFMAELSKTHEYEAFFRSEKIQNFVNDKQIIKHIQDNNIFGLVTNPKLLDIINDDKLMKRFTKLTKRAYETKQDLILIPVKSGTKTP